MGRDAERYGQEYLIRPRLGQGAFRVVVTESYIRRCAITGEKTLPVPNASHIKPYSSWAAVFSYAVHFCRVAIRIATCHLEAMIRIIAFDPAHLPKIPLRIQNKGVLESRYSIKQQEKKLTI